MDAPGDSLDFARLKHILLKRIAELEIEQAHTARPAVDGTYKRAS
jgi:hypothetical protein